MANATREVIIQRLSLVRCLCESEEQRLLEQVHSEEERAHQCILTQRAHWDDKLRKLDSLRTSMVDMLTHLNDLQLIVSQERVRTRGGPGSLDVKSLRMPVGGMVSDSEPLGQGWVTMISNQTLKLLPSRPNYILPQQRTQLSQVDQKPSPLTSHSLWH